MRPQQKSGRSRGKSSRRPTGNVVNRVFDSAGPEGKVRGTPQQIIEKYESLARDAQTSGDRVVAENFLQHAEHYTRMLSAAEQEREAQQRRDNPQDQQQPRQDQQSQQPRQDQQQQQPQRQDQFSGEQPSGGGNGANRALGVIDPGEMDQPDLVHTPEGRPAPAQTQSDGVETQSPPRRTRRPRPPRKAPVADQGDAAATPTVASDTTGETPAS